MNRNLKIVAIIIGVLILVVILIPFFLDANSFRPKLESELTDALGRPVKVGNLSLSLLSGAVKADDISIADDPAFSQTPFVQAKSLSVGVELMPLIFSKSLNVTDLTLNQPEISLVRSQDGERWNFSSLGSATSAKKTPPTQPAPSGGASSNPNLSVSKLNVSDGRLTISRASSSEKPRVYDKVNITVTTFSFTKSFPFKMTADLPAGGTLALDGTAGPIDASNAALTPLQAKVTVHQMNLAASGFIDPASGIAGIADFDGTVSSDGREAKTIGTLNVEKLQVVQKGSPAGRPVQVKYSVTYDLAKQTGTITQGEIALGKAVEQITGTYDAHANPTSINMKLDGQGMPVDDLEAMLPAIGVTLPPKSELKGGTVATHFTIVGPVDKLVTTGTLRLENSTLAGFSLGSSLSSVSALGGKGSGGKDTVIQNLSANVRVAPDGTRADDINLTIPTLGTLTGAGTVSPTNALDFKMKADAIPFLVQGTTSDPKFIPDVKGMAGSLLNGALGGQKGQKNPLGGLGGILKK
ncbi:MAG: AsmA family protein [Candidatus Sulfotelmatobacter sp.]